MSDYNTTPEKSQYPMAVLRDVTAYGKERPWTARKRQTLRLADIYDIFAPHKAGRLRNCGRRLQFRVDGDKLHLASGMFCKVRLCPMCQWRRSRKIHLQMTKIMSEIGKAGEYTPIAINPTLRNCSAEDLPRTIDALLAGWRAVWKSPEFAAKTVGWYRALEITYNRQTGTYHPHLHCIALGRLNYYKKGQIAVEDVAAAFRRGAGVDYNPNLKLYALKRKGDQDWAAALLEFCKYTVPETWDLPAEPQFQRLDLAISADADKAALVEVARTLDGALHHRRLIGMGGLIADYHKVLNLDDPEDGDLDNTGDEAADTMPVPESANDVEMITYVWRHGAYIWDGGKVANPDSDIYDGYRELSAMQREST